MVVANTRNSEIHSGFADKIINYKYGYFSRKKKKLHYNQRQPHSCGHLDGDVIWFSWNRIYFSFFSLAKFCAKVNCQTMANNFKSLEKCIWSEMNESSFWHTTTFKRQATNKTKTGWKPQSEIMNLFFNSFRFTFDH